jgi:hypothetical protein
MIGAKFGLPELARRLVELQGVVTPAEGKVAAGDAVHAP